MEMPCSYIVNISIPWLREKMESIGRTENRETWNPEHELEPEQEPEHVK